MTNNYEVVYQRLLSGKLFDFNFKPYKKDFLIDVLKYFEQFEEYEKCFLLKEFIDTRFDHDLNYKNIEVKRVKLV